jgi:hypothetical protein
MELVPELNIFNCCFATIALRTGIHKICAIVFTVGCFNFKNKS